jgi:hypothetical protein
MAGREVNRIGGTRALRNVARLVMWSFCVMTLPKFVSGYRRLEDDSFLRNASKYLQDYIMSK